MGSRHQDKDGFAGSRAALANRFGISVCGQCWRWSRGGTHGIKTRAASPTAFHSVPLLLGLCATSASAVRGAGPGATEGSRFSAAGQPVFSASDQRKSSSDNRAGRRLRRAAGRRADRGARTRGQMPRKRTLQQGSCTPRPSKRGPLQTLHAEPASASRGPVQNARLRSVAVSDSRGFSFSAAWSAKRRAPWRQDAPLWAV